MSDLLNNAISYKNCLITGGSGFIGKALVPALLARGAEVTILSRQPEATKNQFNQAVTVISDLGQLDEQDHFDCVINLAGFGIADKRWSDEIKQKITDSRIQTTSALIEYFNRAKTKPTTFISGSAIGVYGLRDDQKLDETAGGDDSFSSQLCQQWEAEAKQAEGLGIRTCYLRTGVVLGKNGGALSKMLPPFKFGLGGPMGSGTQWMSWIHRDDLVGITLHLLDDQAIQGAVNGTAPTPVTNKEFSSTLGKVLKRPAFLPLPAFVVKLMMGEMGEELLLSGQRVVPSKALATQYSFKYPDVESALREIL